jgi:hypothetical protein
VAEGEEKLAPDAEATLRRRDLRRR